MYKKEINLPRHWPILFILKKLGVLNSHFRLQKYIFLAKTEKKLPIGYIFVKEAHGPYCVEIKQDARDEEGLIEMTWDSDRSGWTFKIKDNAMAEAERIIDSIPYKWKTRLDGVVDKYKTFSATKLEEYVYRHHVKSKESNDEIVSSINSTIKTLGKTTEKFPPTYNLFLIQGIIEYCLLALKRLSKTKDIVQQSYLIRNIFYLLSSVTGMVELVEKNPSCFCKMDLRDLEEDFEHTQKVCNEVVKLPILEDLHLSDITGK